MIQDNSKRRSQPFYTIKRKRYAWGNNPKECASGHEMISSRPSEVVNAVLFLRRNADFITILFEPDTANVYADFVGEPREKSVIRLAEFNASESRVGDIKEIVKRGFELAKVLAQQTNMKGNKNE